MARKQSDRIDLRAAIDMLPRYAGSMSTTRWTVNGPKMMTNARQCPIKIQDHLHNVMTSVDDHHYPPHIEWVDVSSENIHVLHRNLSARSLMFLYGKKWQWQKWPRHRLPIYLRFKGKLIVWNGTHRMTLGRLTGKKIRARVFDLDHFFKWKKTHPVGWDKPKRRKNGNR